MISTHLFHHFENCLTFLKIIGVNKQKIRSFLFCASLSFTSPYCVVLYHMPLQMTRLLGRVITFLTDIWFFASVGKHVSPQIA